MLEHVWRDVRLAVRGLWRARAFAAAAVLTLSVGIAGTTATFALVRGVLLRPLPVPEQDRVVVAWNELARAGHWPFSISDYETLRDGSRTLDGVAGVGYIGALPVAVIDRGTPAYIRTASVTGNFFDVLGVEPIVGRTFNRTDDTKGAERVLVITHGLWQRRFGGSPDVVGQRVTIQRQAFTIVGVMPRDVEYPRGVEAWSTVAGATSVGANPAFNIAVDVVARMRSGVTIAQATDELNTLTALIDADPKSGRPAGLKVVSRPYVEMVVGDMRTAMLVLFGAVGLVLLVASANVANLLLLRSERRGSELAVRLAVGADRFALARQALSESFVLAVAAGMIGLIVASWTLDGMVAFVPGGLVRAESVRIDAGVIAFCVLLAFVTTALAGVVPALVASRSDLVSQLRGAGRGHSGRTMRRSRRGLVVAQVALAVTTVAAAGLLIRSMMNLESVGIGLDADRLVLVPLELPQPKYAAQARHLQFLKDVVSQFESSPDIRAVTPVNTAPLSGVGWDAIASGEGQTDAEAAANPPLNLEAIHDNYFETFDVPLVRGRAFTSNDREGAPDVAIVSEDVADRMWPGQNPLGKRIKFLKIGDSDRLWTVVGVARPTRYRELSEPRATLYLPAEQFLVTAQMLVVRSTSPVEVVGRLARERIRNIDPDVQVMRAVPFLELLDRPLARPRFNAVMVGVFGGASLLLACVGLYAVMAAFVRQRVREIGIRVALGATARDVRELVLGEGLRLTGAGVGIGLATALGSTSMMRSLLYDVHPLDPSTMLLACVLLLGVSALASYLPARGAARIDPITALRAD